MRTLRFDIITIFPKIFDSYFSESMIKRAKAKGIVDINIHNLRNYTTDKHKKVDDRPFGGGPGMIIKAEPIIRAVDSILKPYPARKKHKIKIIILSTDGKQFTQKTAAYLAKNYKHIILIAGRYEGIDERVKTAIKDIFKRHPEKISIGPYILSGGELPAMVIVDAVLRHLPGFLGKKESLEENRFRKKGLPAYTRPAVLLYKGKNYKVPKVLISGNHKKIAEWRNKKGKPIDN